ncbi:unnamed protein product [Protopolystoma xenopodis]|uniref:Uncharacterized protein n=1 Tax=Protopolystoma xenopodis TaxID=117903 RepID=A0A3S5CRJ1_9PLAT|nr:unnamed protein product [Protopolystoma xenopodis]
MPAVHLSALERVKTSPGNNVSIPGSIAKMGPCSPSSGINASIPCQPTHGDTDTRLSSGYSRLHCSVSAVTTAAPLELTVLSSTAAVAASSNLALALRKMPSGSSTSSSSSSLSSSSSSSVPGSAPTISASSTRTRTPLPDNCGNIAVSLSAVDHPSQCQAANSVILSAVSSAYKTPSYYGLGEHLL